MESEWKYENDLNEYIGVKPIFKLNKIDHLDKIDYLYTNHAWKYDLSTERELLMNPNISDKEKLRLLVEKCNESIRNKNWIWFITGNSKRPDWHNEIPNPYL